MNIKAIEDAIESRVSRKFSRIEAEHEAKAAHREELKTWAKVADLAMYRQQAYQQRREWIIQVMDHGLLTWEEAVALAKVKFKI